MVDSGTGKLADSLARFADILSPAEILQIQSLQEAPLPTGIRINPLKVNPSTTIHALAERYNWEIEPIAFCDNAWLIVSEGASPGTTIEHRLGGFYLQDASSMVPVSLLEFEAPHPLILDMAASPGGKTTHLIDRSQDMGFVIANDTSRRRIPALRSVIANWGGINQAVTNFPGESFGKWFPETFDIVLLDAPCSMENLRPSPNHPLRETTTSERLRLQDRQIQLLISGINALKIGGQLVYATCSLAPEEDEAVISHVLDTYPGLILVEDVSDKIPFQTTGLTAFENQIYHPALNNALRIWPHLTGMSGFFCARLKKLRSLPISPETPPFRDFSHTHLQPTKPAIQNRICAQIQIDYGLDLNQIIAYFQLQVYQRHESVFLIPKIYIDLFQTLPFESIGMRIGQWSDTYFIPSHMFISRFGHKFTKGTIQLEHSQVLQWIDGRDIRNPAFGLNPLGQYLLVVDQNGRNLGFGKLLPKRLRNLLPRG